jgi:hypothetical protein
VLILEDDAEFPSDFRERMLAFLRCAPDDWEGFMLGGDHMVQPQKPAGEGIWLTHLLARYGEPRDGLVHVIGQRSTARVWVLPDSFLEKDALAYNFDPGGYAHRFTRSGPGGI